MKDKYLGRDGITEKYDIRGKWIKRIQNAGMFIGYGYSVFHEISDFLAKPDFNPKYSGEIFGGIILGTLSYFLGNCLHKRNEAKKEKTLKNLEEKIVEEK